MKRLLLACLLLAFYMPQAEAFNLLKFCKLLLSAKSPKDYPPYPTAFSLNKNGKGVWREAPIDPEAAGIHVKKIFDKVVEIAHTFIETTPKITKERNRILLKGDTVWVIARYSPEGVLQKLELSVGTDVEDNVLEYFPLDSELRKTVDPILQMAQAKRKEIENFVQGFKSGKGYSVALILNTKGSQRADYWHDHPHLQLTSNIQLSPVAQAVQFTDSVKTPPNRAPDTDPVALEPEPPLQWSHFGGNEEHRVPPEREDAVSDDQDLYRFTTVIFHEK